MLIGGVLALDLGEEGLVAGFAEEVAGMKVALAPGLLGSLGEVPVVKARVEQMGNGLVQVRIGEGVRRELLLKESADDFLGEDIGVDRHVASTPPYL